MEFVTLHDLSKEFDLAARVVRYRFHQLRQAGKLKETEDWRRDDYVDDQHFIWKINPLSFMRETGLIPVSQRHSVIPFPQSVTKVETVVSETGNEPQSVVNTHVNHAEPLVTQLQKPDNTADTKLEFNEPSRRFEHEIIDLPV